MDRRRFIGRMGLGALAASLLGWLAFTPSPRRERFTMLKRLYDSGALSKATTADVETLRALVSEILVVAGIAEQPIVNAPPLEHRLHVYLSDPTAAPFTSCPTGNAVYDGAIDTIFADLALFRATELPSIGNTGLWDSGTRQFAFSRTFLRLVLLHELGHRQLHHADNGILDAGRVTTSTQKETEADHFAVHSLMNAYARGAVAPDGAVQAEIAETGLGDSLSPEQLVVGAILFAASQMSVALLFSRGAFSSLYEDPAHPSFGMRVRSMATLLNDTVRGDANFTAYARWFEAVTDRVDSLRVLTPLELHSETPLAGATFESDALVLIDRLWNISRVPLSTIQNQRRTEPLQFERFHVDRVPGWGSDRILDYIWSKTDGVFLSSGEDVIELAPGQASTRHVTPASLPSSDEVRLLGGEPATFALVRTVKSATVTRNGRTVFAAPWEEVFPDRRRADRSVSPVIKTASVIAERVYAGICAPDGALLGMLELPTDPAGRQQFTKFALSGEIDLYGQLVSSLDDQTVRHFLIGKTELMSPVFVWEVSFDHPPILRATYRPMLDMLRDKPLSGQNVPVIVNHIHLVPPSSILITLVGDSILRYDIRTASLGPVFHPGTNVNVNVSRDGLVAFSAFNGFKAFILPALKA